MKDHISLVLRLADKVSQRAAVIGFTALSFLIAVAVLHGQALPDLTVTALNSTAVTTDSQTLVISGTLGVTVKNIGGAATAAPFKIIAFEDRNSDGKFSTSTDILLGSTTYSAPLASGAAASVTISLSGQVLFKGNLIYAMVDSAGAVVESNETNNVLDTGKASKYVPTVGTLNPYIKWSKSTFTVRPESNQVMMTPAVVDLSRSGTPAIVFSTFVGGNYRTDGNLRAISGKDGTELWTVNDPALRVHGEASIAVGDIDGDGLPEILAVHESGVLMAFEHDGRLKWKSTVTLPSAGGAYIWGGPSIADLDQDGTPEIIFGATVLNADGTLRWSGTKGTGDNSVGPLSAVVDLDLDGRPEILAGNTAYRADGSIYWSASIGDGFVAVGNLDADAYPEIALVSYGKLYILSHDGQIKVGPISIPGGGFGGPPTIADVDGDGWPEITVAGYDNYSVFSRTGALKWTVATQDHSSSVTGSSVFDFEGDGAAEVIYGDEHYLRIYRGSDGAELWRFARGSGTTYEMPLVVDVDGDGHAEIVAIRNSYAYGGETGIFVVGGSDNNWANTRKIWNQHTYHITNVNEDGTIPRNEQPNWLVPGLNNFRLNTFLPGEGSATAAPDLVPSFIRKDDVNLPASSALTSRIGNGGSASVPAGVKVAFYNGDPAGGGTLLGVAQTTSALAPGQYQDVSINWTRPVSGRYPIVVVADDDGTGRSAIQEGDKTNNKAGASLMIGLGPFVVIDDLTARYKESGVELLWNPVAGARSYNIYRRSGALPLSLIQSGYTPSITIYLDTTVTNSATYYYVVRWVSAAGQESSDGTEASATPVLGATRGGVPPTILSSPSTRAIVSLSYRYQPRASDPDPGNALTWSLPQSPTGMTINSATGQIDWTPTAAQAGYNTVQLRVQDNTARFATQTFHVFADAQISNHPPVFVSTAPTANIAAGSAFTHHVQARDPDGDLVLFSLDNGPSGMTVNEGTGVVSWTPARTQAGIASATVRARDALGAYATQSLTLTVTRTNQAPQITSQPGLAARVGTAYAYSMVVLDPDGDPVTYGLTQAPQGMTIDIGGVMRWLPGAGQLGANPVSAVVRDPYGLTATQSFTLTVYQANRPPAITSTPPLTATAGRLYSYQVVAQDPDTGDVLSYALSQAPTGMTIGGSTGLLSWTPASSQVGSQSVTIRVTDNSGASVTQTYTVTVAASQPDVPPTVLLNTPAVGAKLTADAVVYGTALASNLRSWTLEYQPVGATVWTRIATGTTAVNNAPLGTFPATAVDNNEYWIRLTASTDTQGATDARTVLVDTGQLKMGSFTISFTDLRVPGVGFAIPVTRSYDTKRLVNGDFGVGWMLGFTDASIRVAEDQTVFVTLPDDRRVEFLFAPQQWGWFGFGYAKNNYIATAGVHDTLESLDCPDLTIGGGIYMCGGFTPLTTQQKNFRLTTQTGVKYTMSTDAGITRVEDRNGNWIQITSSGITASSGRSVPFLRDGSGRIVSITDPKGNQLLYQYDGAGRLVESTDQAGTKVTYAYYQDTAYLTEMRRTGGCRPIKKEYDNAGRMIGATDEQGNRTIYAYDVAGRTISITDPAGGATVKRLDEAGNVVETDDAEGGITRYVYDSNNNNTKVTYPSGRSIVRTFDSKGLLTSETDTSPSGSPLVTTYTYSDLGLIASITHPLGDKVTYEYDTQGNLTARKYRTVADVVVSADSWTYNSNGQALTWVDGAGKKTSYTYSSFGDLLTSTGPDGAVISFEYDATGNPIGATDAAGIRTTLTRDAMGRILAIQQGGKTVSSFTYDALGRTASRTDGLGRTTTYTNNCTGNLTSVTTPDGKTAAYAIHPLGPLASVTDANGRSTTFSYDRLARQTGRTVPGGATWSWGYTPDGLPAQSGFPNGTTAATQFDGHGRLVRKTRPDRVTDLTVDDNGNLTKAAVTAYGQRRETNFTYDGVGRLTGTTDWANRAVSYVFDARNLRTSMSVSGTPDTTYQYDDVGRITEVRTGSQYVDYTYDAAGKLIRKTASNGVVTDYTYDARARLVEATTHKGATVITSHRYTLNDNGLRTAINYADGSAAYGYDTNDRLASESVTSASLGSFTRAYTYDAVGSRLSGGAAYGVDNRLLSDAGGSYGYDANSNRVSYAGKTYSYDSVNHLIGFTGNGHSASYEYDHAGRRTARVVDGARREYVYDGANLVGEAVGTGAAITTRYTFGLSVDEPLFVITGGKAYFYHDDGHGSIWALTDETGAVVQSYGYDAWGGMRAAGTFAFTGSSLVNTLTYVGREYDGESGLYHMRARAYDPATGLFLQRDPLQGSLAQPGTQHPYAYVSANPVSAKDPSGQQEFIEYISIPGPGQQAAALVGYLQGYAVTNLTFIGEFMAHMNSGETIQSIWDKAVAATGEKTRLIGQTMGLVGRAGNCGVSLLDVAPADYVELHQATSALGNVAGMVKAFANGAKIGVTSGNLLAGLVTEMLGNPQTLKNVGTCIAEATNSTISVSGQTDPMQDLGLLVSFGGFKDGANTAIIGLQALRPR